VSRACRGTPRIADMGSSFLPSGLQVPDQAFGELGNVRGEAGRGEVETENYAHRGVPYSQSRVPAKQEYRHAKQQRQRYRYRQSITPFPSREAADVFRASYSIRKPLRFQCGTSAAPVRFQCGCSAVRPRLVVGERAVRLAARPAGTRHAFHASRPAVPRQRTARAPDAGPATAKTVSHELTTSPLLLVLSR
jgi:hypothetical protein